nr:hypothetical protein Itr_chr06CG07650 [Ipomoea trifida]GMD03298.1 hypothetical protein Iba_chr06aCG7560 [Ipomoea batatas]GMD07459.1 hypothetical protein Iba_chr06cCG7430 [Ipomoea batatas]
MVNVSHHVPLPDPLKLPGDPLNTKDKSKAAKPLIIKQPTCLRATKSSGEKIFSDF